MHFLVDAQLPPALVDVIRQLGHDASHVADLGLLSADDGVIWERALADRLVIVSKDEDFPFRVAQAANSPLVVWLRIGNLRKRALLELFCDRFSSIIAELDAGETLVEVR